MARDGDLRAIGERLSASAGQLRVILEAGP